MINEDTGKSPVCTLCGTEDFNACDHLVADIDVTFSECEGGALCDRFDDFADIVHNAFSSHKGQNFITNSGFYQVQISELWRSAQNDAESDPENMVGDGSIFFDLIATLLLDAGASEYPGPVAVNGGPGSSSACRLFFSGSPKDTVTEAYNLLLTTFTK